MFLQAIPTKGIVRTLTNPYRHVRFSVVDGRNPEHGFAVGKGVRSFDVYQFHFFPEVKGLLPTNKCEKRDKRLGRNLAWRRHDSLRLTRIARGETCFIRRYQTPVNPEQEKQLEERLMHAAVQG